MVKVRSCGPLHALNASFWRPAQWVSLLNWGGHFTTPIGSYKWIFTHLFPNLKWPKLPSALWEHWILLRGGRLDQFQQNKPEHQLYKRGGGFYPFQKTSARWWSRTPWRWLMITDMCCWLFLVEEILSFWCYYFVIMSLTPRYNRLQRERCYSWTLFAASLGVNFWLLMPCRAICWSYLKQGEGGWCEAWAFGPTDFYGYGTASLQIWGMSKAWCGKSSWILVIVCIYWSKWAQKNILTLHF